MNIGNDVSVGSAILHLTLCTSWISGIVIAKGFWMTVFSFFPPFAWYLTIERAMVIFGVIQ